GDVGSLIDRTRLGELGRVRPGLPAVERAREHDLRALAACKPAPDDVDVAGRDGLSLAEGVEGARPRSRAGDVGRDPRLIEKLARSAGVDDDGALVLDRVLAGRGASVLLPVGVEERRDEDAAVVGAPIEGDAAVVE